jgi:hypothetical protein
MPREGYSAAHGIFISLTKSILKWNVTRRGVSETSLHKSAWWGAQQENRGACNPLLSDVLPVIYFWRVNAVTSHYVQ